MPADAFGVPVFDCGEEPAPAIIDGKDLCAVGAPHVVRGSRNDLAGMLLLLSLNDSVRRKQVSCRMMRRTRLRPTLMPLTKRILAHTLRCPSPVNNEVNQIVANEGK